MKDCRREETNSDYVSVIYLQLTIRRLKMHLEHPAEGSTGFQILQRGMKGQQVYQDGELEGNQGLRRVR